MSASAHDLIVIGAGPAGAAAAWHAARAGLRVALLDRETFPRDKICGDGLTARAVVELRRLGVEPAVAEHGARVERFELRAPWARTEAVLSGVAGFPDYALVLPRLQLDAILVEAACATGATLMTQHEVRGWNADATSIEVVADTPAGETRLRAPLAILATGAHLGPLLRTKVLTRKPAMMMAIRQYFDGLPGAQDVWRLHYQRQTRPGYGWVFPAGGGLANVGVGLYQKQGESLASGLQAYLTTRNARLALGGARALSPARSFPLRSDFLQSPLTAPRLLIAGEAAGLVNPLTGEGIDYALESGRMAAQYALARLGNDDRDNSDAYAVALHAQYDTLFGFSEKLRQWCGAPWRVSAMTWFATLRPDLKQRLVQLLLGGGEIRAMPSARRLLQLLLRRS